MRIINKSANAVYLLVLCQLLLPNLSRAADDTAFCKPSAIAYLPSLNQVIVGDAAEGVLIQVDLNDAKVLRKTPVGKHLLDVAHRPQSQQLLALDGHSKQLLLLNVDSEITLLDKVYLDGDPQQLAISNDGTMVVVTHRWSQRITSLRLHGNDFVSSPHEIALPFPAGQALAIDANHFLIADAFRGRLALVNVQDVPRLEHFQFRGHNIGGLALSHDSSQLLMTHQILNPLAHTEFDDIHWGNLIQNVISRIPLASLYALESDLNSVRKLIYLGDPGQGFADPGDLLETDRGIVVLSRGSGHVKLLMTNGARTSLQVGRYPVQLIRTGPAKFATVAKYSSELIKFGIDERITVTQSLSLGNQIAGDEAIGESLFYDANLAHDGWMSCSSCHVEGHTPGLLVDTSGDGNFGSPKLIPSLLGVAETAPYGWLGNKATLHEQLLGTLRGTMRGRTDANDSSGSPEGEASTEETQVVNHLVAFLESLNPPPAEGNEQTLVVEGRALFTRFGCSKCHQYNRMTSNTSYDVGLTDEIGHTKFNPPSLRAVAYRKPLFHDGRAKDLSDVFLRWRHQLPEDAGEYEIDLLLRYLRTL